MSAEYLLQLNKVVEKENAFTKGFPREKTNRKEIHSKG